MLPVDAAILLQNLFILSLETRRSQRLRTHSQIIGYGDDSLRDVIISLMRHVFPRLDVLIICIAL